MQSMTRLIAVLAAIGPVVSAQSCISLTGSTQCPAFNASSISTDSTLIGLLYVSDRTSPNRPLELTDSSPFLQYVSSREDFDTQLSRYINTTYVQTKYQNILGCSNVNLSNTTAYYARYTTSFYCNAVIQNSIQPCGLTGAARTPLCADSCGAFAISEETIATNPDLCNSKSTNLLSEIRADFTNCALPPDSLTGSCIPAEMNEPNDCGFSTNLGGLCSYCAASSPNATDSCCVNSKVESRCQGVSLPSSVTSLPPLFSSAAPTSTPAAPAAAATNNGLSGGAIAGIVIGSVVGALLLAILIALFFICLRRRRDNKQGMPASSPISMARRTPRSNESFGQRGFAAQTPTGRVTRMTAMDDDKSDSEDEDKLYDLSEKDNDRDSFIEAGGIAAVAGGAAAVREGKAMPPGGIEERDSSSPGPGYLSSPDNGHATSSQSEQLPSFKDYYSSDHIHPGDRVSVLWGYQPRANDEFELERGDMLTVIGIWDDGWATGVQIPDRADEFVARTQRDSGVSTERPQSPVPDGEVKAFPLVCVCLPQHWQKTIEGSDSASPPTQP